MPFGGCDVILSGDFGQLPPAVGKSLMFSFFNESAMGILLRKFKRYKLTGQIRAHDDLFQQELIEHFDNYTDYINPITRKMLDKECRYCIISKQPTIHCRHSNFLKRDDLIRDPTWSRAPMAAFTHDSIDNLILQRVVLFAKDEKTVAVRWRLPTVKLRGQIFDVSHLDNVTAKQFPKLWGYFVYNLPVKIDANLSLAGKVVNGTKGILKGIRPSSPNSLMELFNHNNFVAGQIITIDCPIGVFISCEGTVKEFENIFVLSYDAGNKAREKKIKMPLLLGRETVRIKVITPGYECCLLSTAYGFQGQTLPKIILDLNKYVGYVIDLSDVKTCFTRIEKFLNLRLMPFNSKGIDHLLKLRHPDVYIHWDRSYFNHVFDMSIVGKHNGQLINLNIIYEPQKSNIDSLSNYLLHQMTILITI